MLFSLTVLLATSCVLGQAPQTKQKQFAVPQGRQLPFYGGISPYAGALPYDPYLNPQLQYPGYYPQVQNNQGLPIQPQVVYYSGGPGQPFLVNPGGAPPGNFLIPQPQPQPQPQPGFDPNIFRAQPFPQRPVFVAGYPKPAHVPPTEKDAEEIPTDPKDIPPQRPNIESKPEKLELDETEPELAQKPQKPKKPAKNFNLRPGQRFFILNGQPLFSNYPLGPQFQAPERYNQYDPFFVRNLQQQYKPNDNKVSIQDLFLRNTVTGQIANVKPQDAPEYQKPYIPEAQKQYIPELHKQYIPELQKQYIPELQKYIPELQKQFVPDFQKPYVPDFQKPYAPELQKQYTPNHFQQEKAGVLLRDALPLQLHNQVVDKNLIPVLIRQQLPSDENLQSRYYEKGLPISGQEDAPLPIYEGNVNPGIAFDYYRYNEPVEDDSDSVVIDAKGQDVSQDDPESEAVESQPAKSAESSVAQAQPGAIALAGPGGVAAAGPRGTALAGEGGLAVSSPHATAIAGPKKDDEEKPKQPKKERKP